MERIGTLDPSSDPIRHPLASGLVTGANCQSGGAGLATQPPCTSSSLRISDLKGPGPHGLGKLLNPLDDIQLVVMMVFLQTRKEEVCRMSLLFCRPTST